MKLARAICDEIQIQGGKSDIVDLVALGLPLYSASQQKNHGLPNAILPVFDSCKQSSGIVVVAPEYNGGLPPSLTNALAWISVVSKDWRDAFRSKISGIATFSGGDGMLLITGLRIQLAYLGLTVIGRPLRASFNKPLQADACTDFVNECLKKASNG